MKSLQSIFNSSQLVLTNPMHRIRFVNKCVKEGHSKQEAEEWIDNAQVTYIDNGGGYVDAEKNPLRMLVGLVLKLLPCVLIILVVVLLGRWILEGVSSAWQCFAGLKPDIFCT